MTAQQIALIGNPNTGKTCLFNALTGSYQYVGNWSGVTVEKKVGYLRNQQGTLIDLPGIYSVNPISADEAVVTDFLIQEDCASFVNIVDASQLKRNLHVTIQLLERGKNLIVGLNMIDVAKKRGAVIDSARLQETLGVPVVPIIARTEQGIDQLNQQLKKSKSTTNDVLSLYYGTIIERAIQEMEEELAPLPIKVSKRWIALQFLDGNQHVEKLLDSEENFDVFENIREKAEQKLKKEQRVASLTQHIHDTRESYIEKLVQNSVVVNTSRTNNWTEKIDSIVTNKFLGIPIFLLLMYVMFMLTFDWLGFPLSDLLDAFIAGPITFVLENTLELIGASTFIQSLILDGIVAGVGGVLVFVPQIFVLFFCLSLLEDSGYMARVTIVMDRLMQTIGLNGKSFIPLIIGFGCNVPGVMAARSIEQPKDRLVTMMMTPFMSCSARLPVYALFAGAFFASNQALVVLSLYVLGIVVALILAKFLSSTTFKEQKSLFIMELPPYRLPQWRTLWRATWEKGKGFIRKAGTYIFGGSVLIWFLSYAGPSGLAVEMDESYLAMIGGVIAPIFEPLGFGTWQASAALLTGVLAKEIVVSTMSIIYFVPEMELQSFLSDQFTPLIAYGFMAFILLYIPCLATVAAVRKETHSRKWTFLSIVYGFVSAYVLVFVIYQVGKLLGY
ncbi:ferrous iron transport protein B [Paraliobacillus quinghaiensis]|uniref:Ferrous iron transport protein B n=1 Tax=Paraliobacillus quinghaiensis TaxID=470815 RepID=A0A917TE19_9BACI|nr:ferrous iron transport protein B [Paraliobacillus quinghaiensis]GGM19743.1 ferrous iron transport protein B [Paraliobacillus quinghaiensis]